METSLNKYITGELLRWGEEVEFKETFAPTMIDLSKDFGLEEFFNPATSPIKLLEEIRLGKDALDHRFVAGGFEIQKGRLTPKPKENTENPEAQPNAGVPVAALPCLVAPRRPSPVRHQWADSPARPRPPRTMLPPMALIASASVDAGNRHRAAHSRRFRGRHRPGVPQRGAVGGGQLALRIQTTQVYGRSGTTFRPRPRCRVPPRHTTAA